MSSLGWKPICKSCKKCLKSITIYEPVCGYCNGCLKNQLLDLYANIAMDVKKPTTIYKTYM